MNADRTFGIFPHVQLGGETGTGGGVRVFHSNIAGKGKQFEGFFVYSGGRGQRGDVLYFDPNLAGSRLYWRSEATFLRTRHRSASIKGAVRDDPTRRFQIERLDVLTTLGWRPHARELEPYQKNVYIEARFGYGRRDFRQRFGPKGTLTDPGSTLQAQSLIGLEDVMALYSFGVQIAYDDRDYQGPTREISHPLIYRFPGRVITYTDGFYHNFRDLFYPERGGLFQAEADYVIGSDDVRFVRVTAEVQRFFTLFFRNRILALRARLEKAHRIGDGIIPYPDLAIFGSYHLRGYNRGFFRGEGSLLLSAEYRYPIWDSLRGRWNAFLFWDEGQVFDDYDQIDFDRFRTSYGGGIIFGSETGFLGKLRVGHSAAEGALVGFTLEQKF